MPESLCVTSTFIWDPINKRSTCKAPTPSATKSFSNTSLVSFHVKCNSNSFDVPEVVGSSGSRTSVTRVGLPMFSFFSSGPPRLPKVRMMIFSSLFGSEWVYRMRWVSGLMRRAAAFLLTQPIPIARRKPSRLVMETSFFLAIHLGSPGGEGDHYKHRHFGDFEACEPHLRSHRNCRRSL